jgi:DNA-binding GntR family transcriptional regulator
MHDVGVVTAAPVGAMKSKPDDTGQRLQRLLERTKAYHTTVGDFAYSVLRQAILGGVLEPGQQLRQDALAAALGMSRIPVRSALYQLESDGLVQITPHRGASVKMLSARQIAEIYEARIVLESYAVRKAIETMTPARLKRLERLAQRLDRVEPGDAFVDANAEFYRELYGPVNSVIAELSERLRNDVGRYWRRARVVHQHEPSHTTLVAYVREGDADAAVAWLEGHLRQVAERVAAMVESPDGVE